jgi:hypothetical protein
MGSQGSTGSQGSQGTVGSQGTAGPALSDISTGLQIYNTIATPNSKVDVIATGIILSNVSDVQMAIKSVSFTIDITASGANGLDTGSEATSTWYYIWAIAKDDGTKAGLFSASYTSPTLPSGYTYKALIGAVYNTSAGNFRLVRQMGRYATQAYVEFAVSSAGYTTLDISSAVPEGAKKIAGTIDSRNTSAASETLQFGVYPENTVSYGGIFFTVGAKLGAQGYMWYLQSSYEMPIFNRSITVYRTGQSGYIRVNGYEFGQ